MARAPIYVLFGHGGLLGKAFFAKLCERAPDYRIYAFEHKMADITQPSHVRPLLEYVRPTVVINCAGESDLELCEQAPDGALLANARGPEVLAFECVRIGAKLVQLSSYQVFDGKKNSAPYTERMPPGPSSAYGRSKWDGEIAIRKIIADCLVVRPGWPFHFEGPNLLVEWIAKAEQGGSLIVRDDCKVSPVFVSDLVDATMELIDCGAKGVFHVANSGEASFKDVAEELVALCRFKSRVITAPRNLQTWFKVALPPYGVLNSDKYKSKVGMEMRTWNNALRQCLFLMHRYKP